MKGAQCSEPVKSRLPSIWFVWKIWDFLVAQKQKLGARGHRALLEHSPGFALSLTLKQRLEAMRKCPIWWLCSLQKVSIKLQHSLSCFAIFNNHNIFINFVLSVLVAQIKSLPLKTSNQGHSISLGKVVLYMFYGITNIP